MNEKKQVPNISVASGLSIDYNTALGPLHNFLERIINNADNRSIFLARRYFMNIRLLPYREYFLERDYERVVTEENRGNIEKLDELIKEINEKKCHININNQNSKDEYRVFSALSRQIDNIIMNGYKSE